MNEIINKNMNEKISDKVYDVYITYLQSLRKNEADVLKFLITLLGSIGGFIYMILKEGIDSLKQNYGLLLITASGATVLIFWGVLYTFAMSYTHRYLQKLLFSYENKLELLHGSHWGFDNLNKTTCEKIKEILCFGIAPSTYKAHLIAFGLGLAFIWTTTLAIINENYDFTIIFKYLIKSAIIIWFILFFINWYFECKIEKLELEINNKKINKKRK